MTMPTSKAQSKKYSRFPPIPFYILQISIAIDADGKRFTILVQTIKLILARKRMTTDLLPLHWLVDVMHKERLMTIESEHVVRPFGQHRVVLTHEFTPDFLIIIILSTVLPIHEKNPVIKTPSNRKESI